jgi:hypothetical protein
MIMELSTDWLNVRVCKLMTHSLVHTLSHHHSVWVTMGLEIVLKEHFYYCYASTTISQDMIQAVVSYKSSLITEFSKYQRTIWYMHIFQFTSLKTCLYMIYSCFFIMLINIFLKKVLTSNETPIPAILKISFISCLIRWSLSVLSNPQ